MIAIRKSEDRGRGQHGWLDTHYSFSFSNYYDPNFMGFSALRVINEDRIDGGAGFPTHAHADMEIITYIVEGALQHKDSMGNTAVMRPGEVQTMSAGTGVRHSEFNPEPDKPTHLLQIWILPDKEGHAPGYGQKSFAEALRQNKLVLTVSNDSREGSIAVHQDMRMYVAKSTEAGQHTVISDGGKRNFWIQVIKGQVEAEKQTLNPGDGGAFTDYASLPLTWKPGSEFIVFDLP